MPKHSHRDELTGKFVVNVSADDVVPGMSVPRHGPSSDGERENPGHHAATEINAMTRAHIYEIDTPSLDRTQRKQAIHRGASDRSETVGWLMNPGKE